MNAEAIGLEVHPGAEDIDRGPPQRDNHGGRGEHVRGEASSTSLQPRCSEGLPRMQEVALRPACGVFRCWTNVWSAVKKLATVTPAEDERGQMALATQPNGR